MTWGGKGTRRHECSTTLRTWNTGGRKGSEQMRQSRTSSSMETLVVAAAASLATAVVRSSCPTSSSRRRSPLTLRQHTSWSNAFIRTGPRDRSILSLYNASALRALARRRRPATRPYLFLSCVVMCCVVLLCQITPYRGLFFSSPLASRNQRNNQRLSLFFFLTSHHHIAPWGRRRRLPFSSPPGSRRSRRGPHPWCGAFLQFPRHQRESHALDLDMDTPTYLRCARRPAALVHGDRRTAQVRGAGVARCQQLRDALAFVRWCR